MDPNIVHFIEVVMVLPAIGIVGGITAGIVNMVLSHQLQKASIKARTQGAGSESLRGEIEALRQELARLRDTSTQYDISIQHALEDLQQRMASVEAGRNSGGIRVAEKQMPETLTAANRS